MMKKVHLLLILFVTMALLTVLDYVITSPSGFQTSADLESPVQILPEAFIDLPSTSEARPSDPGLTQLILNSDPTLAAYQEAQRSLSNDLFERFDLSSLQNLIVYKSTLVSNAQPGSVQVYELYSPRGQSGTNYLNLVLALESQIGQNETLNRTNDYGQSSFFYNLASEQNTGFLVAQVANMTFGFRYDKTSPRGLEAVKNYINTYQALINL